MGDPMTITLNGTTGITTPALDSVAPFSSADMPTSSVLQIVTASYSSQVTTSSSTYTDTGLTATITPTSSSSKVIVFVQQASCFTTATSGAEMDVTLLRGSTTLISTIGGRGGNSLTTGDALGTVGAVYSDSPSTTSATTYKTQFKSTTNVSQVSVQLGGTTSTIMLMEVAG